MKHTFTVLTNTKVTHGFYHEVPFLQNFHSWVRGSQWDTRGPVTYTKHNVINLLPNT